MFLCQLTKYEKESATNGKYNLLYSASFLGVIPSTDFLKTSGVPLSARGDVVVDKVRV